MEFSSFNSDSSSSQQQMPQQQMPQQQMPQNKKPLTIGGKIHDFLVSKSGTIMTNSFGMAIGFALKDFIAAIVVNLFKPLIAFIFNMTHLNNYYDFNSIISPENNAINFSSFITAFLTFIMVIISVYLISLSF
jgi:large-conductance mechanosensitive channel